ncbi:hypothetical protein Q8F57_039045 [Paraburkholderia terrae]|uniref:hypothetical protein n=1 Tax=Paraburkholderia terrae TaxID=311230 RepID=UPI00296B358C|nr:hypothetical protein [Paraburkholderia terrae]MDW3661362.1 hypothetical protein [Paraburkholderia terrae]
MEIAGKCHCQPADHCAPLPPGVGSTPPAEVFVVPSTKPMPTGMPVVFDRPVTGTLRANDPSPPLPALPATAKFSTPAPPASSSAPTPAL